MLLRRYAPWVIFSCFVGAAMYFHEGEPLFISHGPYPLGKIFIWLLFVSFLGYSIYCSRRENIFRTLKTIYPYHWSRQIGIDLYIGLLLSMAVIYLNEGSLLILALWLLPVLLFANLATLLYVAMNYDGLIAHFL